MFRNRHGVLRNIYAETRILLDIQAAVKAVVPLKVPLNVPTNKQADLHVASLHDGQLHLMTNSAAVATRIKYSQKSILGSLKTQKLPQPVTSIKVSVRPSFSPTPPPIRQPMPPSLDGGRQMEIAADHIDDPDLSSALRKLSSRAVEKD